MTLRMMFQMKKLPLSAAIAACLFPVAFSPEVRAQQATSADQLDVVVVQGQLDAQRRAIDVKRESDAIEDVVSSDSMGQYPDDNIGESLQRLPGVSVTRDQGEGRYIVIRGLDAAQNSVQVDGIAMGTPEDSSRAAPLDVIPSESTERLRVIKAPTPDMPGDSLGGTVLVESASAFDRNGRSLRGKVEGSHQPLSGKTSPKAAFNYSEVFGGTFGVALGLSWQDRDYESDNMEVEWDEHDDVADRLVPIEVQQRKYFVNRERKGVNLNFDWRPNQDSSYFLRTLYTDFTDAETRQRSIIPIGEGDITGFSGGAYTVEGIDPGDFSRRVRWRTKAEDTFTVSAGGENRFGASLLEYQLGYTKVRERVNDEVEGRFSYEGADDMQIRVSSLDGLPRYEVLDPAGDAWLRNANYSFNRFVPAPKQVDDDALSARVDFRFDTDAVRWKTGLAARWRDRDVNVDEVELRRGPALDLADWTRASPSHRQALMGDGLDAAAMMRYLAAHGGEYTARPQDVDGNTIVSTIEDYVASEDVLAGYGMATFDVGPVKVVAGARVERTRFKASGFAADIDADGVLGISPSTADKSYTDVLPSVHLRWEPTADWVVRGAYTHTIARPSFGDISPRASINREDEEAEFGNPDLDPYLSRNLDLSFERYIGDSGLFSAGVFHKKIDGYIVETWTNNDARLPGFDVVRPINGQDASVFGVELNWQQKLDMLPGLWSGLLVGLSGTWLDTEFVAGTEDRAGEKFTLPRSSEQLLSGHIGYEWGGLSTRLSAVHRSEYLEEIGDSAAYDLWVAPNTQLDLTVDYKIGDNWGLYLEASNLLDEPLELYQGDRSQTFQNELYGRTYVIGVKGSW